MNLAIAANPERWTFESIPNANDAMRRIRIRHLLLATTFTAITLAVAREFDDASTQFAMLMTAASLPFVCYCIGELVAPSARLLRQWIRLSLLVLALVAIGACSMYVQGAPSFLSLILILFIAWTPQLILLRTCSNHRRVLVDSPF